MNPSFSLDTATHSYNDSKSMQDKIDILIQENDLLVDEHRLVIQDKQEIIDTFKEQQAECKSFSFRAMRELKVPRSIHERKLEQSHCSN